MSEHKRGMWNMPCFNGLSDAQKKRVVEWGNLPMGYEPEGPCLEPAEIEIQTVWDHYPGPRFYCRRCAVERIYEVDRAVGGTQREQERIRLALEAARHSMTTEEYDKLMGF